MEAEQTTELLRDRGGPEALDILECPDAAGLLSDAEAFLHPLLLGNVDENTGKEHRPVAIVENAAAARMHPSDGVVGRQQPVFLRENFRSAENGGHGDPDARRGPPGEWPRRKRSKEARSRPRPDPTG